MTSMKKVDSATRARIVDLAIKGVRPALINEQIPGVGLQNIYNAIRDARKAGFDIDRFPAKRMQKPGPARSLSIEIDGVINRGLLLSAARRRRMTESRLARRLMEIILADGMIDAILDDGVSSYDA